MALNTARSRRYRGKRGKEDIKIMMNGRRATERGIGVMPRGEAATAPGMPGDSGWHASGGSRGRDERVARVFSSFGAEFGSSAHQSLASREVRAFLQGKVPIGAEADVDDFEVATDALCTAKAQARVRSDDYLAAADAAASDPAAGKHVADRRTAHGQRAGEGAGADTQKQLLGSGFGRSCGCGKSSFQLRRREQDELNGQQLDWSQRRRPA